MNIRSQQIMNMAGSCLGVALHPDYKPVWFNQEPLAFGAELAEAEAAYASATTKAALAEASAGGAADAKAVAENLVEVRAHRMARALCSHFTRHGDLDRLGRVNLSRSAFSRLRKQELVNQATAIRDIASSVLGEPDADHRGLTSASVDALKAAITAYSNVLNLPRSQSVNQGTLLKESDTEVAALARRFRALSDLVIQFGDTEQGARFVEAWRRARIILDSGRSSASSSTAQTTPATPTPSPEPAVLPPAAAA